LKSKYQKKNKLAFFLGGEKRRGKNENPSMKNIFTSVDMHHTKKRGCDNASKDMTEGLLRPLNGVARAA